jgi:hypothetical protein
VCFNSRAVGLILTKFDMNVMSLKATPSRTYKFPALDNSNVAVARICDVWSILAPIPKCGKQGNHNNHNDGFSSLWNVDIQMGTRISKRQRTRVETVHTPVRHAAFQSCFLSVTYHFVSWETFFFPSKPVLLKETWDRPWWMTCTTQLAVDVQTDRRASSQCSVTV